MTEKKQQLELSTIKKFWENHYQPKRRLWRRLVIISSLRSKRYYICPEIFLCMVNIKKTRACQARQRRAAKHATYSQFIHSFYWFIPIIRT